jgi:hypothetical protein
MQAALGEARQQPVCFRQIAVALQRAERQRLVDKPAYDALERKYKT